MAVIVQLARGYSGSLLPTLGMGFGDELEEILVTFQIPGQEHKMIGRVRAALLFRLGFVHRIDPQLAANNGFDPIIVCQVIKLYTAKQIAMIGDGQGRQPILPGPLDELGQSYGALQEAVGRM